MRIDLVFPVLPPTLDGIGDHTARLAEALASHADVRVLTAQDTHDEIPGVEVETVFSLPPRRGVYELIDAIQATPPDWLFIQFNQFSYGRWGLNPFLPHALNRIQRTCPGVRVAVMFHEDFVPVTSWKFALMTSWQRVQFWMLGRLADHVFFSIEPWSKRYASWFPDTPVNHLPVGSNIPYVETDRHAIRQQLGIGRDTFVIGVFGSLHASRLLSHIRAGAEAIHGENADMLLLYVGPHGTDFKEAMDGLPVYDAGRLPAAEVSRHFQAMDIHLTPFIDGVSTRRGSFMTGLQHGVATLSTSGPLTDSVLIDADGEALQLAPRHEPDAFAQHTRRLWSSLEYRVQMGAAGKRLYDDFFTFEATAAKLVHHLAEEIPV